MNTEFLSPALIWAYLTTSILAQVFLLSTFALLCGLGIEIWLKAVRFSHLNHVNLHDVEFEHPHLASIKDIAVFFLCSIALLMVALAPLRYALPFSGPYESIQLMAIFLVCGAVGIVAELHWKGASKVFFAGIVGTSTAFIILTLKMSIEQQNPVFALLPLGTLIACLLLAWRLLHPGWSTQVRQMTLAVCLVWLLLFLFS